jgi:hypothetical protein
VSESPQDRPLTPEEEAIAAQFAEQLASSESMKTEEDEDGVWWFTYGDFTVPVTPEQQAEFAQTLYNSALAKARSMAPVEKKPYEPPFVARLIGNTVGIAAFVLIAAAAGRLVVRILGIG